MSNIKTSTNRTRNYACIVYPESAPKNWKELLEAMHIPALISPIHDQDTLPDGTTKKEHYHVIILFGSLKSPKQAKAIFDVIGGVGIEAINCTPAYARYLTHMDNPDKAQYSSKDVIALSGADYEALTYVPTDDLTVIQDMLTYIKHNQIISFSKFVDICRVSNLEWLKILALKRTSHFFLQYLKSLAWDMEQSEKVNYKEDF